MKIAIDESPITSSRKISHSVRGVGYYLKNIKSKIVDQFPEDEFFFFTNLNELPDGIDIIHYPYFEPFFLSLPTKSKEKTVVTVHDLTPLVFPEHFPSGIKGKIKWQIQKNRLNGVKRVITDSEFSKKDIVRLTKIPENIIDVVYLAAGDNFKIIRDVKNLNRVKKMYDLPEEFLLYVGDGTWNKNLVRLAHAVIQTGYPLVICGRAISDTKLDRTNPWNQELVSFQNIIINNKLFVPLGYVEDNDLPLVYNLAKIFLMPSLYEGFGLPVLEAMKCGLPVITSRESSLPEVAGDAALFVDAYNEDLIADGINSLWEDKKMQEDLISKGLSQANKFSWNETAKKTYESYKKAFSG